MIISFHNYTALISVSTISTLFVHGVLNGPVGCNHGNLQNTPLLALGYRALGGLPR